MSEEQKITKLKRVEKGQKLHAERVAAWDKKAQWQKTTRDVLAFALFALVLAALWNMMPTNDPEPPYTPAQVAIASPTFLAMATAVTLQATPTLAPTATDTATPQATNTGTASATATATSAPTAKPTRPALAVVKLVTAVPTPLPPLDLEPFRFPVSVVALCALIIALTITAMIYVSRIYAEPIAAAVSQSTPAPMVQPVTNQINVYASQPVSPTPIYADVSGIHLLPSDDFGEGVDTPTAAEDEAETAQNEPVSRVTPETRAALLFERAAKNGGVPLFSGDRMPEGEEWGDIHALYKFFLCFRLMKGEGGAKKATYEILWGRSSAGEGSYKIYSDKMIELDKEQKNEN